MPDPASHHTRHANERGAGNGIQKLPVGRQNRVQIPVRQTCVLTRHALRTTPLAFQNRVDYRIVMIVGHR